MIGAIQPLLVMLLAWCVDRQRSPWLAVFSAIAGILGMAYGLWFRGIGRLSPVAVSAMSLLSPVTAVVLGWIFLGQKIQGMALVGLIVVLASVLSIQRALARQAAGAKTKKAP